VDFETRPFYHLAMLARDGGKEGSAEAVRACMDVFLDKARKEEVPIWLETATEESRKEYEGMGFRVCEEVTIGKGRVDAKGWPQDGGEGVKTWAMIWDDHLQ